MATKKQKAAPPTAKGAKPKLTQKQIDYRAQRSSLARTVVLEPCINSAEEFDYASTYKFTPVQVKTFESCVSKRIPIKTMGGNHGLPSDFVLWYAIADPQSPIYSAYARGKQRAVAQYEEEIDEVARTTLIGEIITEKYISVGTGPHAHLEKVTEVRRADAIEHRRLLIDTHKWTLAHLRPKKHGKSPDGSGDKPNDQLSALFDALSKGPSDSNVE